ncbi:MAG: hypothetical protein AMJ92_11285 [candidate division Zixibacteria bacterium SM23_81]|nr:MAG: hypothetical protein AMJ92_11285 [candidate division Zixibacteria bacterium SM23_81]
MSEQIDVKKIERKAYMSYHQDGLWDIFLGAIILAWGVSMMTEMASMNGVWFVVLFPLLMAAKRRITYPRLGYAEFPRARRSKLQMTILLAIVMLLGVLVLLLWMSQLGSSSLRDWLRQYFKIAFGAMVAIVLALMAVIHWIKRLYVYAGVIFLSFAGAQRLNFHMKFSFIAAGAIIAFSGLVLLIRFLRKYPLPERMASRSDTL